jgi:hypothetical protein
VRRNHSTPIPLTCPVCFVRFPSNKPKPPGEDPDCCSKECSYIKAQRSRHQVILAKA